MTPRTFASSSDRPRLVCRTVRLWSSVSGESKSGHAATCADCENYFRAMRCLEADLRTAAVIATPNRATSDLAQQIIQTIRTGTSDSVRERSASEGRLWKFGGLLVAASLALLLSLQFSPRRPNSIVVSPTSAEGAEVIVSAVQSLSSGLVDSVIPSAGELAASNPLQQELGSVYSDVRSALDFLALNFLPTAQGSTAPQPARQI